MGTIRTTDGAALDRLYSVNVRGVFNASQAFIGPMLARRSGNIVNIASIGGIVGIRDRLAYCTTKFAVVGMTKSMALDHATEGGEVAQIDTVHAGVPELAGELLDELAHRGTIEQREAALRPVDAHPARERPADRTGSSGEKQMAGFRPRVSSGHDSLESSANHSTWTFLVSVFHIAGPRNRPGETSRISSWILRM